MNWYEMLQLAVTLGMACIILFQAGEISYLRIINVQYKTRLERINHKIKEITSGHAKS